MLLLEAAEVGAIGIVVIVASVAVSANPVSGAAAGGTALVTAALLVAVAIGTFRARPWTRAAALVWQVVQLLVGLYAFQGAGAAVGFGLAAVVPAAVAIVLLFTRRVRDATARG